MISHQSLHTKQIDDCNISSISRASLINDAFASDSESSAVKVQQHTPFQSRKVPCESLEIKQMHTFLHYEEILAPSNIIMSRTETLDWKIKGGTTYWKVQSLYHFNIIIIYHQKQIVGQIDMSSKLMNEVRNNQNSFYGCNWLARWGIYTWR